MFALSFTAMLSFASVAARLNEGLQSSESTSLCDKYTTAILKNNTAADQFRFIKLLMNTAQYGNYTTPNVGISVPGILTPGTYDGHHVALFKYFDGSLPCINNNNIPTHITFLTKDNFKDTNLAPQPNHYTYFGTLLGCSQQSSSASGEFPAYTGTTSMYEVHKFMFINQYEIGYFIQQIALAAASIGFTDKDTIAFATALMDLFGFQCLPPRGIVIPKKEPQSVCTNSTSCQSNVHSDCTNPVYANLRLIDSIMRAVHPDATA